jgi:hypothetical protein
MHSTKHCGGSSASKAPDIVGASFGLLRVLARDGSDKSGSAVWLCVCACGNKRRIAGTSLRAGRNKSCGCASPKFVSEDRKKHGLCATRTYKIWLGMRARCSERAVGKSRRLYFLKGIRVCERWRDYLTFLQDMGEAPLGHSIDRIDGTKGYEPGNCRWATIIEQANNTSANKLITFDGKKQTLAAWAKELAIKQNTLCYRLLRGWTVERALKQTTQKRAPRRAGHVARHEAHGAVGAE